MAALGVLARRPLVRGVVAAGLCLLAAACTIPWGDPDVYSGTVVDRETGEPIEGAVALVVWSRCRIYEMNGCGIAHSPREAVTGSTGAFSIDASPDIDWNPLSYVERRPEIVVYAPGYKALSNAKRTVAGFDEGDDDVFVQKFRTSPRIALERIRTRVEHMKYGGGWPNPSLEYSDAPAFLDALNEYRDMLGYEPLGPPEQKDRD